MVPDVIEDQESVPLGQPALRLRDLFFWREFFDAEVEPFGELSANLLCGALAAVLKDRPIKRTLSSPGKLER